MRVEAALLLFAAAAHPPEPPDLARLLEAARVAQEADVTAWAEHRFRRQAIRETLRADGSVEETEDLEFIVTPTGAGFDEQLTRIDGREPEPSQIERHRKAGRFGKRFAKMRAGEGQEEDAGGYSLSYLLKMSSYRYAGREKIEGVACHRIEFDPGAPGAVSGVAGRLTESMTGTIWLTEDGLHIFRAAAGNTRAVSLALGLAHLSELRLEFDSGPVTSGAYAPRRIEVWTRARVFGVPVRRHNLYRYSDFARRSSR
ncbi:MAG TPA: hypothetical protein VFG76_07385 [Candidatus Polarisedimenticolia bacterium]|nr:hypothetical protein [Candidatus Polarisedimenticolia bacterium]